MIYMMSMLDDNMIAMSIKKSNQNETKNQISSLHSAPQNCRFSLMFIEHSGLLSDLHMISLQRLIIIPGEAANSFKNTCKGIRHVT